MQKPNSRTAPDLLDEMASKYPGRRFLVDGETRLSYGEFRDGVRHHAKGLIALGLGKGSRVAMLMGNRVEWLTAYFAAMSVGAEVVALSTLSTARELAYQLTHAEVSVLVFEPKYRDRDFVAVLADAVREHGLDPLPKYIPVEDAPPGAMSFSDLVEFGGRIDDDTLAAAQSAIEPGDTACILYTSGSTALPKGVPLYHSGLIDNMWSIGERQHLTPDDRLWLAVSLFWSYACVNALFTIMTHGASIVLQHHFEPGEALRLIEQEKCTVFYGTPALSRPMWDHPDRPNRDLSSLRTGATIGSREQVQTVIDLGVTEICNVYGLTEAYGNSCVIDGKLPLERRLVSSGAPLDGVEIKIADFETGVSLPMGEIGEVRVRGHVTKGYLKEPERTAEALDEEGFLRTGDLGTLDEDGFLTYRGRRKEMVKTGGINVAPAEIEAVYGMHDGIEQIYVTGIPSDHLDEALAAVIVLSGAPVGQKELITFGRGALAGYKVPRHYRFVASDELPLTSTGKLQRNRLAEFFD
jgi:fatty-acyl-CoA synthase